MAPTQPKSQRTPSTDELDYQRRLDEDFAPDTRSTTGEPVEVYAPYAVKDNDTSGYVGVSPEYMTYASETEKPLRATEGTEGKREARALDSVPTVAVPATSDLDKDTSTAGGGSSSDLVYTASSGEGFTAKLAEVPAEVESTEEESTEEESTEETSATTPAAPPAPKVTP